MDESFREAPLKRAFIIRGGRVHRLKTVADVLSAGADKPVRSGDAEPQWSDTSRAPKVSTAGFWLAHWEQRPTGANHSFLTCSMYPAGFLCRNQE